MCVFTEEAEITEDGEEVVGFGLRKLLKTEKKDTDSDQTKIPPRKQFSLDFPPGLVHEESECIKSPKQWKEIKRILERKKKRPKIREQVARVK